MSVECQAAAISIGIVLFACVAYRLLRWYFFDSIGAAEHLFRLGKLCREYTDLLHGRCEATARKDRTNNSLGAQVLLTNSYPGPGA